MKTVKRIVLALFVLLFVVSIGCAVYVLIVGKRAVPNYNNPIVIEGLKNEVSIFRDSLGIPHIYAENESDLYRVTGYLMASDRLWQMDLMRRLTQGRLSEIFGERAVDVDLLMRALRISAKSEQLISTIKPEVKTSLESFADGVNQYLEEYNDKLPPEFFILGYRPEKWKPVHSLNLIGYMAWTLSTPWETEVLLEKIKQKVDNKKYAELIPWLENQQDYVFAGAKLDTTLLGNSNSILSASKKVSQFVPPIFCGSNTWAVSGKKSTSGKPLLANDMHLDLNIPGIWYQMHQVVKGKLNVSGVAIPGQPLVVVGHNKDIAWGMTNVSVDDMDFYLETINPENPNQYKFNEKWLDFAVIPETIQTKEGKTIVKELKFNHRGPIVSEMQNISDKAISMRWAGNMKSNEFSSIYKLNRAKNWTDFREAMKTFVSVSQNVSFASVDGDIGLQCCAGIPLRKANGVTIVSGETDEYDWKGLIPFEKLPYVYNPQCGYISAANNRTIGTDYLYHISYWFELPYRFNRINSLLESKSRLSADDFRAIQNDQKSELAEELTKTVVSILENSKQLSKPEQQALKTLKKWNYVMDKNSVAPLIFEELYFTFVENLLKDELPSDMLAQFIGSRLLVQHFAARIWKNKSSHWSDNIHTPNQNETFAEMVTKSFKETIAKLENKTWGEAHTFELKHPLGQVWMLDLLFNLNRGSFSMGGSSHTISPYTFSYGSRYAVFNGSSQRYIWDLDNWENNLAIIPTGTSGIPSSKHFCDQTEKYLAGNYYQLPFKRNNVEKKAQYKTIAKSK